ncbi:hypothetical protein ACFL96_06710, partial [Thermoproteota archaeon]
MKCNKSREWGHKVANKKTVVKKRKRPAKKKAAKKAVKKKAAKKKTRTRKTDIEEDDEDYAFQPFEPKTIDDTINSLPLGTTKTVYRGIVAFCEVDVYHSSDIKDICRNLSQGNYDLDIGFIDEYIKKGTRPIIEKYDGYFHTVLGDNIQSIFGVENLE